MSLQNSPSGYGSVTRALHWLTALLILTTIALGLYLGGQPIATDTEVARTAALYSLHKTIGVTIFALAWTRILWGLSQTKPRALHPERRVETFLGELVHKALYGAMIVMPLSGWISHAASTGFAPILWPLGQSLPFVPKSLAVAAVFATLHGVASKVLIGSLILHVAGALKHALIDRDATLDRMITGSGPLPPDTVRGRSPFLAALALWSIVVAGGLALGLNRPASDNRTGTVAATEATAGNWAVESGTLTFTVRQMGAEVRGSLTGWSADITYDEAARSGAVRVSIPLSGMSLGAVTQQAAGPEFFDIATYPQATFRADIADAAGQLVATGTLTLRGKAVPVALPFTLNIDSDKATMTGSVTLDRRDFGMGPSFPDETTVAYAVRVDIAMTAIRQ